MGSQKIPDVKVIMFAGKGGVGKTTCAASTALHYSRNGENTLLISTDPTPSLGHIFQTGRCRELTEIGNNLFLDEIGVDRVKQMWNSRFGKEVYEVFSSVVDIEYDDFVEFMSSVLPGLRDEFMVDYIREIYEGNKHGVIVWDTAPLGQTLGLLNTPAMLRKHLKSAPRIYSRLKLGNDSKKPILDILKSWEKLSSKDMEFLRNKVGFTVVTIPEALAFEQLDEIFDEFEKSQLNVDRLVINNVIRSDGSQFLISKAESQQKYIELLHQRYDNRLQIVEVPMFSLEIKGLVGLSEFANKLFTN